MRNRKVGTLIVGIAVLIGFIIYSFNRALSNIVSESCSHGSTCPMWGTLKFQTNVSMGLMIFVVILGIYLMFAKKEKINKPPTKANSEIAINSLTADEKFIFEKVVESEGTIFQSDLVEKTDFTKVKVTRILDRLEGKGLIERKRRGMTNVVILKRKD